jgi:hypothetical protein
MRPRLVLAGAFTRREWHAGYNQDAVRWFTHWHLGKVRKMSELNEKPTCNYTKFHLYNPNVIYKTLISLVQP